MSNYPLIMSTFTDDSDDKISILRVCFLLRKFEAALICDATIYQCINISQDFIVWQSIPLS